MCRESHECHAAGVPRGEGFRAPVSFQVELIHPIRVMPAQRATRFDALAGIEARIEARQEMTSRI
jgi:hypothetical protein